VLGEEHVLALADEGGRERRVDGHRAVSLGGIESSGSELVEGARVSKACSRIQPVG